MDLRTNLKEQADALQEMLEEHWSSGNPPLRPLSSVEPVDSHTNGVRATIGRWKRLPPLEIWLDKWLGGNRYKYWVGFYVQNNRPAAGRMIDLLGQDVRPTLTDDDLNDDDFPNVSAIARIKSMKPVLENYGDGQTWCYGIYDLDIDRSDLKYGLFSVRRAAQFVVQTVDKCSIQEDEEGLTGIEGGRSHRNVEISLRSSALATERKRMDGFRCQGCDFRFDEMYGKLGRQFAEAHHMVELHKLKDGAVTNSIEDLRTLCSNCHRMIHRLLRDGIPNPVSLTELREIIRTNESR